MMMMMMMVQPSLTPADGHTRSKRERGKIEYLYADESTQLRSSTMDRSLETFPKSIHDPVSRDTISPVDPKKPIYLNQVDTLHIPRPPPPSLRKEEAQRTIITTTNDRSIHAQKHTYYQHLH